MSDRLYNVVIGLAVVAAALGLEQLAYTSPVAAGLAVLVLLVVGCVMLGPFDPRA